jgi:hypothetical protein
MRKTITLNSFRRVSRQEEAMMRAMMPTTSAADPAPLTSAILPALEDNRSRRTWRAGSLVTKTGFTLAEVAHA